MPFVLKGKIRANCVGACVPIRLNFGSYEPILGGLLQCDMGLLPFLDLIGGFWALLLRFRKQSGHFTAYVCALLLFPAVFGTNRLFVGLIIAFFSNKRHFVCPFVCILGDY